MFYRGAFKGTLSKREFCKTSYGNEVAGPTTLGPDTSSRAVPPSWCGVGREEAVIRGGGPLEPPPTPTRQTFRASRSRPGPSRRGRPGERRVAGPLAGPLSHGRPRGGRPLRAGPAHAGGARIGLGRRCAGTPEPLGLRRRARGPCSSAPARAAGKRGAPGEGHPWVGPPGGRKREGCAGSGEMVAPFHLEPLLTRSPRRVQLGVSPPPAGPQPTPAPSPGCAPETGSESSRPRGPRPVLRLRGVEAACRHGPARRGVRLRPRALPRALPPHGEAPETPRMGGGGDCLFVCLFVHLSRSLAGGKASVSHA